MKEKILNLIKEINLKKISHHLANYDLISCQALLDILIKEDKINIIIDANILKIDSQNSKILIDEIKQKLASLTNNQINIIFTSNQSQSPKKPEETPQDSKIKNVKNIIVIASGKGGVGKSTIAANLAISLKKIGFKVGLADADIYGPSITHLMNLQGKPQNEGNLMLPINSYGIECISVGSLVESNKATVWRGPMASKALNQLIAGTKWPEIDYLIIDLPPGTGDVHLSLIQQFHPKAAIMVTTPHSLANIDVIKAADMFSTLEIPIIGIIQNMAYLMDEKGQKNYLFGKDGGKKLAGDLKISFLGDIPILPEINQSNDQKQPICYQQPSHPIALEFGKIAENIIDYCR